MQLDASPVYNNMGKDNYALMEGFGADHIKVVEYVHETEVDTYDIDYNEVMKKMSKEELEELLMDLTNYATKS